MAGKPSPPSCQNHPDAARLSRADSKQVSAYGAMPWAFTLRPVGAGKARFVTRPFPVGAGKARFVTRPFAVGAGKARFVTRPFPVGAGKARFVTRPFAVGAGKARFVTRPFPVGAGKARFVSRPLPFGLEARHTDGFLSKLTRGVSAESFVSIAYDFNIYELAYFPCIRLPTFRIRSTRFRGS